MQDDVERIVLLKLADRIDACVEDAKRPHMSAQSWPLSEPADPRIVSLANGLTAISEAIRSSLLSSTQGE